MWPGVGIKLSQCIGTACSCFHCEPNIWRQLSDGCCDGAKDKHAAGTGMPCNTAGKVHGPANSCVDVRIVAVLSCLPLSSPILPCPSQVFLEETSLVARPAVPFPDLKERLDARMKWLGIKVRLQFSVSIEGCIVECIRQQVCLGSCSCRVQGLACLVRYCKTQAECSHEVAGHQGAPTAEPRQKGACVERSARCRV